MSIAKEVLQRCKDIVEGKYPQPEPFTIKKTGSTRWSVSYPSGALMADWYEDENGSSTTAIFSRILGMDKPPAEIVLKWEGNRARYNEYITAETYSSIHQKGWHPRIYVGGHRVDEDTWNDSQAEAQQWCADTIKKLVTPQP